MGSLVLSLLERNGCATSLVMLNPMAVFLVVSLLVCLALALVLVDYSVLSLVALFLVHLLALVQLFLLRRITSMNGCSAKLMKRLV